MFTRHTKGAVELLVLYTLPLETVGGAKSYVIPSAKMRLSVRLSVSASFPQGLYRDPGFRDEHL